MSSVSPSTFATNDVNDTSFAPTASPIMQAQESQKAQFEHAILLWYSFSMFLTSFIFFLMVQYLESRRPEWVALIKMFDVGVWTCLYFGFSVTLVVYNKWLISVWEFEFPLFITLIHMCIKFIISWVVVFFFSRRAEIPKISRVVYYLYAAPVGVTTALDVAASNASFFYVSIALYTVVKSTSLIFVFTFSVLYGIQKCEFRLLLVTLIICGGVLMATYSDSLFDPVGFTLVFLSAALGGYRWCLTEILMSKIGTKMNSLMTIYTIAPASVIVLIPFTLWLESGRLMNSKFFKEKDLLVLAIINVVGSGLFAYSMIYVELAVLHRTSSLSLGVIGYLKQIFQIVLSVLIFHDVLSVVNVLGVITTFFGMIYYSSIKNFSKAGDHKILVEDSDNNNNHRNSSNNVIPNNASSKVSPIDNEEASLEQVEMRPITTIMMRGNKNQRGEEDEKTVPILTKDLL